MAETVFIPQSDGSSAGLGGMGLGALLIGALLGGRGGLFGGNNWGGGWGGPGTPAASAVASEVVLTPTLNAIQGQINTLASQVGANATNSQISSGFSDVLGAIRTDATVLASDIANVGAQVSNVATAQASANFTTLQSLNTTLAALTAQNNQNALQQLNSFNQQTVTLLQGFNTLQNQNQNATNQIIAQGTAISAQLADCCCKTQIAIKADGDATRALINDLNVQNLRDQLAAANNKVSNNDQNQYLLQTILSHLSPRVTTREV